MMRTFQTFLVAGLLLLLHLHCEKLGGSPKSTTVRIKFTDFFTNAPVSDLSCTFAEPDYDLFVEIGSGTSSADGIIEKVLTTSESSLFISTSRPGYISKLLYRIPVTPGQDIDMEVKVRPFDAVLRVQAENKLNEVDSLHFDLKNGVVIGEQGFFRVQVPFERTLIFQPYEKKTLDIPVVANDPATIYWSWDPVLNLYNIPFKKVVTIPASTDTLVYEVSN